MKVCRPYKESWGRGRARPARAALLATAVCAGLYGAAPLHAFQDSVPRVANSIGYAEALLHAQQGGSGEMPRAERPAYDSQRPSEVAEVLLDLPPLPASARAVTPVPTPQPAAAAPALMAAPALPAETTPQPDPQPAPELDAELPPPPDAQAVEEQLVAPDSAPPPPTAPADMSAPIEGSVVDPAVGPVACPSCGGLGHKVHSFGEPGYPSDAPCTSCGGSGMCVPGQGPCYTPWLGDCFLGRFASNLYECLCCPDPCYQPAWIPEANSALFVDYARPRTLTRFRWDRGWDMVFPDRAEYFWARQGGKGPPIPAGVRGEPSLNWNQLYMYQEVAADKASFFIEQAYRNFDPLVGPWTSGFSDLNLGTKSLLVDCELMQLTFQFRTWIPVAAANKGLGTGHVSLEPSLLLSLRLAPETFFQGQLSEWIPISGTEGYEGCILHYHFSFNQVLWRPSPDMPLIAMWEFNGWSFQDGAYTSPTLGPFQKASEATYFSMGPSLRLSICDKIDFGVGYAFSVTDANWADNLLRMEFRILY